MGEKKFTAPMILEGLVKVGKPFVNPTSAVCSGHFDGATYTEQWFTFQVGDRSINPGGWGALTTAVWGDRLPFTPKSAPTSSADLQHELWAAANPTPAQFFAAMKSALLDGAYEVPAGYAIGRFTVEALDSAANSPEEKGNDDAAPLFRERMYEFGTTSPRNRAHFAANHLVQGTPGPTAAGWVRKRLHRGLWRHTKVTLPPGDDLRSDAITDEDATMTASQWWTDRRAKLDPDNTAGDLTYARFWVYEYRFADWSQLAAPPNP